MDGVFNPPRGAEKCIKNFGWKARREDLGVDGRILKYILEKYGLGDVDCV
jgi:hypothetical protein